MTRINRSIFFISFLIPFSYSIPESGICPPVLDLAILFDSSGGTPNVFEQQKNWTIGIVRELPVHQDAVRITLLQYAEEVKTEFNLSRFSERNDMIKYFDEISLLRGNTKSGGALLQAETELFDLENGARLNANRIVIIFTDGLSMDNPTKPAKILRRRGVKIIAISVNSIGFVPEMLGIVGDSDNIYGPNDEDRLKERLLNEVEKSRSCEVQPKKLTKTTSSFTTTKATEAPVIFEPAHVDNVEVEDDDEDDENHIDSINDIIPTESTEGTKSTTTTETLSTITSSSLLGSRIIAKNNTVADELDKLGNETAKLLKEIEDEKNGLAKLIESTSTLKTTSTNAPSTTRFSTLPTVLSSTTLSSAKQITNTKIEKLSSTRSFFNTRVTFRPVTTSTKTSSTQGLTTVIPSTEKSTKVTTNSLPTLKTVSYTPTATPKKLTTTVQTTSSVPPTLRTSLQTTSTPKPTQSTTESTSRKWTPTGVFRRTLPSVTAFPTLLAMEKSVTLPINKNIVDETKSQQKKKIRRIIKRRRNIPSNLEHDKITDSVIEIIPTTPTSPAKFSRNTFQPEITEEEEIVQPGVQCPMDILFVVDSSGSIAQTYDTQKDFLTSLIKRVEPSRSHRVGLIQFAGPHLQKMEWSFDTHSKNSQLLSAIRSVRHLTGTTYIGAALELSLILLDSRRKHTDTTVILVSDGFSQDDSTQQAKLLRQLPNVKMYAISMNTLTNTKQLTDIVGDRKNVFINEESKWFEEFFTKKLKCVPTNR